MGETRDLLRDVFFLGHASFQIRKSRVVYIDPYQLSGYQDLEKADIILISHSHYDHCSKEDIEMICSEKTKVVATKDCRETLKDLNCSIVALSPFEETEIEGVKVRAVPAYNIGKQFHPKENGWNGYVFNIDGVRYYHTGDTDRVPEMDDIETDIVFLPVGGTYTMTAKEACEVARKIDPKIAVPMHYGSVVGSVKDAEFFVQCVGEKGIILPQKNM